MAIPVNAMVRPGNTVAVRPGTDSDGTPRGASGREPTGRVGAG